MQSAVVEIATNIVVNMIVADPAVDPAPEGCILVGVDGITCDIGWIYDPSSGAFSNPNEAVI